LRARGQPGVRPWSGDAGCWPRGRKEKGGGGKEKKKRREKEKEEKEKEKEKEKKKEKKGRKIKKREGKIGEGILEKSGKLSGKFGKGFAGFFPVFRASAHFPGRR
jgi:hypothetical protein